MENKYLPGVGVDVGTSNLCVSRQKNDGSFEVKHHRNMLLPIECSQDSEDLLSNSKYLYIKSDNFFYVVGDDALKLSNALGRNDIVRPMQDGLLNPSLKSSQKLLNFILKAVVGSPIVENESLRFSVPSNPVDRPEMNNIFHTTVLTSFFQSLGYSARPINEALASLYFEDPCMTVEGEDLKHLSGYSLSFGAGMCNSCVAIGGMSVAEFSITKCGDFIDKSVATVTSEPIGKIIRTKERDFNLNEEYEDSTKQALSIYYDEMINRVVRGIKSELSKTNRTFDGKLDIVLAGGTSMPKGFAERFGKAVKAIGLPFGVNEVRASNEPFYSVVQGCCLAARSDSQKKEK